MVLEEYAGIPVSESLPQAKAYALKAQQIDDSLAEVHATLGLIHHYSREWSDSERELKRSIEINPNYPSWHHWYSAFLHVSERLDEALVEIKRAQELDPLSGIIGINVGHIYSLKRDYAAAEAQLKKTIELDPNWWGGHFWLGATYLMMGRYEESIPELQKSVELSKRQSRAIAFLGYALAKTGRRQEALSTLKELEARYAERKAIGQHIASVHAGLGDRDLAFQWLEKDFQARSSELIRIRTYAPMLSLSDDPRFADLVKRIGFQQ